MEPKYRASQIIVENLKHESEPWVHLVINEMLINPDGSINNEIPRMDRISKRLSQIGTNLYTFTDPVTQQKVTISGYGMASAIASYVNSSLEVKYGEGAVE